MNDPAFNLPIYRFPYRVFYADTDAGGVMYYANYLRMFEQARALYIEEFGLSLTQLAQNDCLFVCRHAELHYHAPAFLDDQLLIDTQITQLEKTSLLFEYTVQCQSRWIDQQPALIAAGTTQMVCCRYKENRVVPKRIPKWLAETLRSGQNQVVG